MIFCHCSVVTDRDLRARVDGGATSVGEVLRATGAGAQCGGCTPAIRACVRRMLREDQSVVTYQEVWNAAG